MKRNTLGHPKVELLAAKLGLEPWGAVGILESLWCWAGRYTPHGEISQYPLSVIASAIGWRIRPKEELFSALVETKWLDHFRDKYRIHDWASHADDATRKSLERQGICFATGESPRCFSVSTKARQGRDAGATKARLPEPEPGPGPVEEEESTDLSPLEKQMRAIGYYSPWWKTFAQSVPGDSTPGAARCWVASVIPSMEARGIKSLKQAARQWIRRASKEEVQRAREWATSTNELDRIFPEEPDGNNAGASPSDDEGDLPELPGLPRI